MEVIFNITNIKSTITFLHLAGLALGIGGAWILDGFIIKHLTLKITQDKYDVIVFVSKIVLLGLLILWLSGFLFISYYYFYTPDMLFNQKVWAKIVIVTILTINGVFVHKTVLPKFQSAINDNLLNTLSYQETKIMVSVGTLSFISWLFPMVLGVTKTLNFSVSAIDIVIFYSICIGLGLLVTRAIGKNIVSKYQSHERSGSAI